MLFSSHEAIVARSMEAHPMGTREPGGHSMASFKYIVLIMRLRESVFQSLATLEHIPRWSGTLEEDEGAECATTDPARAEADGPRDRRDPRRGGSFEIIGYEAPRRLTLAGHIGGSEAVVDYRLDELALGTLVTCRIEVKLADVTSEAGVRLATSRIETAVSGSLEWSKQLLETGDVN
jgi:hypothetical protein